MKNYRVRITHLLLSVWIFSGNIESIYFFSIRIFLEFIIPILFSVWRHRSFFRKFCIIIITTVTPIITIISRTRVSELVITIILGIKEIILANYTRIIMRSSHSSSEVILCAIFNINLIS